MWRHNLFEYEAYLRKALVMIQQRNPNSPGIEPIRQMLQELSAGLVNPDPTKGVRDQRRLGTT